MASEDTRERACATCGGPEHGEGCRCLDVLGLFTAAMRRELEANAEKGGREGPGGWVEGMTPEKRISELLYHSAKLAYAQRQHLQGDGDADKVVEFAADVGNCALMIADGLGLLPVLAVVGSSPVGEERRLPEPPFKTVEAQLLECEDALAGLQQNYEDFRAQMLAPIKAVEGDSIESMSWDDLLGAAVRSLNAAQDAERELERLRAAAPSAGGSFERFMSWTDGTPPVGVDEAIDSLVKRFTPRELAEKLYRAGVSYESRIIAASSAAPGVTEALDIAQAFYVKLYGNRRTDSLSPEERALIDRLRAALVVSPAPTEGPDDA